MKGFISPSSIVREIWGSTDIVLFIFAGAAAEFALNKQVDWLYFTGKLPADPIGRLFSTVQYAQQIIFDEEQHALSAINRINTTHAGVESARGKKIPEPAYQDVLYMLIHYSIAAFELLERKLTLKEKEEIVNTFYKIGHMMNLKNMPASYADWSIAYTKNQNQNLVCSELTKDLFKRYRQHLGRTRYFLVLEIQRSLVSESVNKMLHLGKPSILRMGLPFYKLIRKFRIQSFLIKKMVPERFIPAIKKMDQYKLTH